MLEKFKSYFKGAGPSVQWVFGRKTTTTDFSWTKSKGMGLYEVSLFANRAINKRADKVGEVEFKLYRGEKELENEWTELLRRPNPIHTGDQFWKLYQKYKDIFGEAYIYKEASEGIFNTKKVPKALWLLRPDLVEKKYNADETEIIGYVHTPKTGNKVTYTPEQIIYSFNPDPRYPLQGESLLRSGLRTLEIEIQANEYQAKSIKSGGTINSVIKVKDALNKQQVLEMRDNYRALRDESWEEGRPDEPLFAGGDIDVLRTSMTPAELSYIESKKMTLDEVAILTNTPRDILGLTSGSTYANADAAIRVFLRETIKPLVLELADILNWRLIPDEFELVATDPTPEDRAEARKDLETANNVHAITINEKRRKLGLDPVANGDDILVPLNVIPLQGTRETEKRVKAAKSPACRQSGESKEDCVERKIPELIGEGMSQDQAVAVANSMCSEKCESKQKHPLRNEAKRRQFGEMYIKKLERRKEAVDKAVQDFFKSQEQRITSYIEKSLKSKSMVDDAFNMDTEINLAKSSILPVIRELFREQGKEHLIFLGSNEDFNFTSQMETSLNKRTDLMAQSINATTLEQLQRTFKESLEAGETRKELVKRISDKYDDISKGRAEVIARTETHYALQTATLDAIRQSGKNIKIWVWVEGVQGGVREDHLAIDGEERPVEYPFSNGLMFPGDGGPEDSINCQCALA